MANHATTFMSELNAGEGAPVDNQLVPMVKFLTKMGFTTLSSCQGDPGPIAEDGGRYGHVSYRDADGSTYVRLTHYTFELFRQMFAHMYDDVMLSVYRSEDIGFYANIIFRNEAIEEVTKRLGVWCEMNHK
jgi:hypothetical protein